MKYLKQVFGGNLQQYTMVLALVLLAIVFDVLSDHKMLTPSNAQALLAGNAYVLVLAIGMVMVIVVSALLGWLPSTGAGPGGSSETIRTSACGDPPTMAIRSASTTPVHSASALQPSTQAIGRWNVLCGMALSSATFFLLPVANTNRFILLTPYDRWRQ